MEKTMEKTKEKIIVIDDEVHILHVISLKLRNAGYEVITAQDGKEALETVQVELPDLIITDYQMPFLSGLELCQRLKQLPSTRHIPAIMLTARGFALETTDMQDAGITTCINKPFGPRELLRIAQETLAPKSASA